MKPSLEKKLQTLVERYEELKALLSDAETISQQNRFRELSKEFAQLGPLVAAFMDHQTALEDKENVLELLKETDPEIQQLAKHELKFLEERIEKLQQEIQLLLLPRDPNDDKNIFLEIRAGAGGDEAAIFAGDLCRMYTRYAEAKKFRV